jgi:hypothetical protein
MSLRSQVLRELDELTNMALAGVASAIEREALRRRANAPHWYAFHRAMHARLPRVRWLARAWHRMMARRYEAMAEVERKAGNPIAAAFDRVTRAVRV